MLKDKDNEEAVFKVLMRAEQTPEVVLEQYLHARGYSRAHIEEKMKTIQETIPALSEYKLIEAWTSSRTTTEGTTGQLAMKLKKDSQEVTVYVFTFKGTSWVSVYGL